LPILDKEENRKFGREWRTKRREKAIDDFGRICNICGDKDGPFDFDHIDPATKEYSINKLWSCSKEIRKYELAKCQLLCRKCHNKKSSEEKMKDFEHGTVSMYRRRGCRCQLCRDANRDDKRAYRDKKKKENNG
jgi:hypothetical protein